MAADASVQGLQLVERPARLRNVPVKGWQLKVLAQLRRREQRQ